MQHMSNSFNSLLSDQVIALEWGTVFKDVLCLFVWKSITLKIIYKRFFKSFIVLYADRICPEHHFVENRIENFPSV